MTNRRTPTVARRKFIAAISGLAGSSFAAKLWAEQPCAPPALSIERGSSTTTPCGMPAHIAGAATGQWTAVALNRVVDVRFDYSKVSLPGSFRTNIGSVIAAWSGAVYAPDRGKLYVNGGGHRDYDGNEWYAFDLVANAWERVNDPALFNEYDVNVIDGVFPNNTPIAMHTYGVLGYLEGKLYRLGAGGSAIRHPWSFNPATKEWTEISSASTELDHHDGSVHFNPSTGKFQLLYHDGGSWAAPSVFDPATGLRTVINFTGQNTTKAGASAFSGERQEILWRAKGRPASGEHYGRWDLRTNSASRLTSVNQPSFPTADGGAHGFAWDSRRDRYVAWHGGKTLHYLESEEIDSRPSAMMWSSETPVIGVIPSAGQQNGTYGRFQYIEEYDVFIAVNGADENVFLFKPSDWAFR